MKKYTSPAVTGRDASALFNVVAAAGPITYAALEGSSNLLSSAVKYVASKLFGEDFSGIRPDALMPCLES